MNGTVFRDHCEAESHAEGPQWSARQGRRRVCSCCGSRLGPAWCVCERGACARRSLSLHRQDLTTSGNWCWPSGQAPVTGCWWGAACGSGDTKLTGTVQGSAHDAGRGTAAGSVGAQRAPGAPPARPSGTWLLPRAPDTRVCPQSATGVHGEPLAGRSPRAAVRDMAAQHAAALSQPAPRISRPVTWPRCVGHLVTGAAAVGAESGGRCPSGAAR